MEFLEEKRSASINSSPPDEEDQELVALGYKPSFKREFTNLSTVSRLLPVFFLMDSCGHVDQLRVQYNGMVYPTEVTKMELNSF